ncbi:MAG: glycosyltransferase [Armatimonadetes bacterium]|nr:glycosyltransferase [Armatimonadota bacterium]NIM23294.1 glycosyltransferase [Armatimonadota bacterium]NIM67158.1 glycosyltransferase [Armatimonadota bacterium]NIM75685.1 glycosyltransferase [Armatimonadota bacterium]NIN05347.1 glycosyltransferase [Armatimonadota bacterium]
MNFSPPVIVIIPHWNRRDDLRRCLCSLEKQTYPHRVLVVDNASTDGSAEMLEKEFAYAQLYRCEQNLGFGGAVNVGLRLAVDGRAKYVLLLNNDTVAHPRLLEHLVRFAQEDPARGVVAPSIYYLQPPERLWSAGGEVNLARCLCRQLTESGEAPRKVDYASGCALLVSVKMVECVGMLDPRFFMYFEEVDWCLRARRAGFEVWHLPQAKMWHAVSTTLGKDSPAVHYYMTRNRLLLLQKNRGLPAALLVMGTEYFRSFAVAGLRRERARSRALWQAMADFISQRFGEKPPGNLEAAEK